MSSPRGFGERTVSVEGRTFSLQVVRFGNGCFAAVAEGEMRLGSLTVSLYNRTTTVTTQVIPSRSGSLFMRLAAERLAVRTDGVAILSVNVSSDIPAGAAKEIMREMDEMVS